MSSETNENEHVSSIKKDNDDKLASLDSDIPMKTSSIRKQADERFTWDNKMILTMLNIIGNDAVLKGAFSSAIISTKFVNIVVEKMEEEGVVVTAPQVKRKFKKLQSNFHTIITIIYTPKFHALTFG